MRRFVEHELNRLYKYDWDNYNEKLDYYKSLGYKILRNFQGDHRVEYCPDLKTIFGGVFGEILQKK